MPPAKPKRLEPARRGAASRQAIPAGVLRELHAGAIETRNLVEWLALDLAIVAESTLPPIIGAASAEAVAAEARASAREKRGIAERTRLIGAAIAARLGSGAARAKRIHALNQHRSDTVRGWCAYALVSAEGLSLDARLAHARPFAADSHFGVRELAWLALRPALAAEIERAIALLAPWCAERDANLRRFASEATRPRGVWCAHIGKLKAEPALGMPVLEPLHSDPDKYVRDSVGNWLNDAAKDQPDWVRATCARWTRESRTPETAYIVKRALRSVGP